MLNLKIVGIVEEPYEGDVWYGHNCDFEVKKEQCHRLKVYCLDEDSDQAYEIVFENESAVCGSGWSTCNYGKYYVNKFDVDVCYDITDFDYIARGELYFSIIGDYRKDFISEAFLFYSYDGGDQYYPCGGFGVDKSYFKEVI